MRLRTAALILFAFTAQAAVQSPEQYFGHRVGADKKLVRWDRIVEYLQKVANESDRVRFRTLGQTTLGNPFVMLEILDDPRSEEHTSELQSHVNLVCRLLLEKKKKNKQ